MAKGMKIIRRIIRDRSSSGAIAALALLLLLLQGLASGYAHGSMSGTILSSKEIICSSHAPDGATGEHAPGKLPADGCCGTLCRLASISFAALVVSPAEVAGSLVPHVAFTPWPHAHALDAPGTNRESQPRAPPHAPLA